MYTNFIGIDVSKNKINVFFDATKKHIELPNKKANVKKAFAGINNKDSFVVLENTGGYENACVDVLYDLGFDIHKTNNQYAKYFIRSLGKKAKTDRLDAEMLAEYGRTTHNKMRKYQKPSRSEKEMRELALYLDSLKIKRASEKNKLEHAENQKLIQTIKNLISYFDNIIQNLEEEIALYCQDIPELQKKIELLTQYKGIGKTTAVQLLSVLPELGTRSRKEIAALAGVSPYTKESGMRKGYSTTKGSGRYGAKKALFMAALSAIRFNQNISKFYNKLLKRGKRKMVAMVACMRKMVIHLNTILKKGEYHDNNKSQVDMQY